MIKFPFIYKGVQIEQDKFLDFINKLSKYTLEKEYYEQKYKEANYAFCWLKSFIFSPSRKLSDPTKKQRKSAIDVIDECVELFENDDSIKYSVRIQAECAKNYIDKNYKN